MTDLKQRKWKPEEGNGCGEEQCGPGWASGEQQNQAGQRNRSEKDEQMETAGERVQEHREEQPVRETKQVRQPRENRERAQERKSQDPDLEIEVMVLSLHQILELSLTKRGLGWTPSQHECPRN